MATLEDFTVRALPESLKALQESSRSLSKLASDVRDLNETSTNKKQALEQTKQVAFQSLASVAYQVNVVAQNLNNLLELQLGELEGHLADVLAISEQIVVSHEFVGRNAIGDVNSGSDKPLAPRVVKLAEPNISVEDRTNAKLDFSLLDGIGLGRTEPRPVSVVLTNKPAIPSSAPPDTPNMLDDSRNRSGTGSSVLSFKNRVTQKTSMPVSLQTPRVPSVMVPSIASVSAPATDTPPPPPPPNAALSLYSDVPLPPPPAASIPPPPPPSAAGAGPIQPQQSVLALYDYTATSEEEISIAAGEILIVTNADCGDGWMEGQNNAGLKGLFPQSYVEYI